MRTRRGIISQNFITSRRCNGEWMLGREVEVLDSFREDDYNMLLCDITIPATGRNEKFHIPEEYIEYTDGQDKTVPSADSEQVVHEG